jgi:histidinol-phosphatase (PHP family)
MGDPSVSRDSQARDLPLDAHLHTDLSPDSDVPIDAYARAAVERGIAELAITDHVDFEPGAPAFAFTTFTERERSVREAAARWAEHGVAIHFGVEITWDRAWADEIADHLATHAYDFAIGSVHVYRDSPYAGDRVAGWVAGRSLAEAVAPYFDKRYLTPHITAAQLAAAPELYEPILTALVESGTALEINTSGLRQEAEETYPAAAIVARFHALGGRAITIGSDAHRADTFAWALDEGYAIAADAGFGTLRFGRGGAVRHLPLGPAPNVTAGRSL